VSAIVIKATSTEAMTFLTADVETILLSRHRIDDPENADFSVLNQNDLLSSLSSITATFTILLGAIGGISLLVGGIGIMNIMLVSVHERTREIGIRKAVGARRRDILSQFLIEAVTLTGSGGLLGIGLGWAITELVSRLSPDILVIITAPTVAMAVGVSVAIGIAFGLYPAMRAARLHPIEALRYE
jgi:putative ABC transport system permease protein